MARSPGSGGPRRPDPILTYEEGEAGPYNRPLLQVVIYPKALTVDQFDWLLHLYQSLVPPDRITKFKIAELPSWSDIARPALTRSARDAVAQRRPWPYFEASRDRIRDHRALEAQLWDGREMGEGGTYNLHVRALKYRETGLHWFVRFLLPLDFQIGGLVPLLRIMADNIDHYSGHGGVMISFSSDYKYEAFTEIYAKVRRFWGIDIDILDLSADKMRDALQPPCWLNSIGRDFAERTGLTQPLERLRDRSDVSAYEQRYGTVFVLGERPSPLDRNRLPAEVAIYREMAKAMDGHILRSIGQLTGEGFGADENATDDWLSRFTPGSAWGSDVAFRG